MISIPVEKKQKNKDDPVMCILRRVVRRMKKDDRPITFQSVCEEIEKMPYFPTLADEATTTMVKQVIYEYELSLIP